MEVVLRPVNDLFLRSVVFPAFELGVVDAVPAIEHLLRELNDEATCILLELVLEHGIEGSFFGLADERWSNAVYRLLFHEWIRDSDGWVISEQYGAYAGPWEETFHVSLMLEDVEYPYADATEADAARRRFWATPRKSLGLSTLLTGTWDPLPSFPPDQVLTIEGHGQFNPKTGIARADWSWRPMIAVSEWAARLPSTLNRLLEREARRLRPVVAPERSELLDYWLGRSPEAPVLAVSFSGLGPRANEWIRHIGLLAHVLRQAARAQQGLTAVISRKSASTMEFLVDER